MPRRKMVDPATLSMSELRHLLATKEKMEKLEERRASLAGELAAVEAEMAKLLAAPAGKARKKAGRPAKKTAKKAVAKKTAKKAVAKKAAKKAVKKAVAKKAVRKAGRPAGKAAKKAPRVTVESVVADLIRGQGSPMSFQDIFAEITKRNLVKTKSRNFANVLRRTLSTSKALRRVGRGVYDVKK